MNNSIIEVERISDRIIQVRLSLGETIVSVISIYAPQIGLTNSEKDKFYDDLLALTVSISEAETLLICGDFNGHIGENADGFEGVYGGHGFGTRNIEGDRILEFATANNLVVTNSCFQKRESHLITYRSGRGRSQIDYILVRKRDFKLVKNVKVVPNEECVSQHLLLIADTLLAAPSPKRRKFIPKCRVWKLKHSEVKESFLEKATHKFAELNLEDPTIENLWQSYKSILKSSAESVCGMSKNHNWRKET